MDTNWFVITGGPSCGKTKIIDRLAFLGYSVVPEAARILIDQEKSCHRSVEEIRADEVTFQNKVLDMKVEVEDSLPVDRVTFFDRGIPDSIAYNKVCNLPIDSVKELSKKRRYKAVFLLDLLPFKKDYARIEDEETSKRIHELLYESYTSLGYNVIRVPKMPIAERVQFILEKIKS